MAMMTIKMKKPHLSFRAGDVRKVPNMLGSRLIHSGYAVAYDPEPVVENKAVESSPAEPRAAGRAKKLKIDNKAVGA